MGKAHTGECLYIGWFGGRERASKRERVRQREKANWSGGGGWLDILVLNTQYTNPNRTPTTRLTDWEYACNCLFHSFEEKKFRWFFFLCIFVLARALLKTDSFTVWTLFFSFFAVLLVDFYYFILAKCVCARVAIRFAFFGGFGVCE